MDGEQAPLIRDSLEAVRAAIAKLEPRARNQILDGAGDEYFVGSSDGGDARTDMHRDPYHAVTGEFAFAGVQSRSHLES